MVGAALIAISLAGASIAPSAPDLATIQQIERSVRLPATAAPLDRYDRAYAPSIVSGRKVIVGLYLATQIADERERRHRGDPKWWKPSPPRKGRLSLVPREADLPDGVLDGGCEEIHVYWDIETSKTAGVFCNGLA